MIGQGVSHANGRIILVMIFLSLLGCKQRNTIISDMSSDMSQLKILCNIPDYVSSCEWQTFNEGNDWGILMILRVDFNSTQTIDNNFTEQPSDTVMLGFATIPPWLNKYSVSFENTNIKGIYKATKTTYEPELFKKSPLLNGFMLKIDDNIWLVGLHTQ